MGKVKKTYVLGENRLVSTRKEADGIAVIIKETNSDKTIDLPAKRWQTLVNNAQVIDDNVNGLHEGRYVKLFQHLGGGCFVSVTTGFKCVDIRHFYIPGGSNAHRPTKQGIALRLGEWETLKTIMAQMVADVPATPPQPHDSEFNMEDYLASWRYGSTTESSSTTSDAGATATTL
jgi:hypothetical protein